jgi:hypothetical protein
MACSGGETRLDDWASVYAPVSKMTTIRTVLAVTAARKRELISFDVKAAYLNAELSDPEPVYVEKPPGFRGDLETVWRLKRAMYGLRGSPKDWWNVLRNFMTEHHFEQSKSDPCLFTRGHGADMIMVCTWVDDILVSCDGKYKEEMHQMLKKVFDLSTAENTEDYLGMKIDYDLQKQLLKVSQQKYIEETVCEFELENAPDVATPMLFGQKMSEDMSVDSEPVDWTRYRQLVGRLLHISVTTRPDISYAVSKLCQYMKKPRTGHWKAAIRVLRYLKTTKNYGLCFDGKKQLELKAYCDSDWAGEAETSLSHYGYVYKLGDGPIAWRSTRQKSIMRSSTGAEFYALDEAAREGEYLRGLLSEMGENPIGPTTIYQDNIGSIATATLPRVTRNTKHLMLRYNKIKELVKNNVMKVTYLGTKDMVADVLTKSLGKVKHRQFCDSMGIQQVC